MNDLVDQLRKRLEFTEADRNMAGRDAMFAQGITIDAVNARLAPLHDLLLRVVEAAEREHAKHREYDGDECSVCDDLAALREAVGSGE